MPQNLITIRGCGVAKDGERLLSEKMEAGALSKEVVERRDAT